MYYGNGKLIYLKTKINKNGLSFFYFLFNKRKGIELKLSSYVKFKIVNRRRNSCKKERNDETEDIKGKTETTYIVCRN